MLELPEGTDIMHHVGCEFTATDIEETKSVDVSQPDFDFDVVAPGGRNRSQCAVFEAEHHRGRRRLTDSGHDVTAASNYQDVHHQCLSGALGFRCGHDEADVETSETFFQVRWAAGRWLCG